MQELIAICFGIGLSAACGFRIFVPFLVMSIANRAGMLDLTSGFDWIGSTPALLMFATATALEIGAYYVPWLDNLMDSIATPAAAVAGAIVTASFVSDMHPMLSWSLAIIAGGGSAAVVQTTTVVTRAISTATTGGLGNPVVSTVEAIGAVTLSILAIVLPMLAAAAVLVGFYYMIRWIIGRKRRVAAASVVRTDATAGRLPPTSVDVI